MIERDIIRIRPDMVSMDTIVGAVGEHFDLPRDLLRGRLRARRYSGPRHVAMWLATLDERRSLPQIARYFSRDHTSVMHGRDHIQRRRHERHELGLAAEALAEKLRLGVNAGHRSEHVTGRA